jgi:hypothetical protein
VTKIHPPSRSQRPATLVATCMAKSHDQLLAALAAVPSSDNSNVGKLLRMLIDELNDHRNRIAELEGRLGHLDEDIEKLSRD